MELKNNVIKKSGIEILRIIATFMICMGHVNISIYCNVSENSSIYPYVCFAELACLYGVNIYGLITGYVSISKQIKLKRFFRIWLEVIFYTIIGLIISYLFFPELISKELILQSLFPISTGTYWYVTAYIGVLLVSPILNTFINSLNCKMCKIILVILMGIAVYSFFVRDIYGFGWGYNSNRLIYLYCVGALLKKIENIQFDIHSFNSIRIKWGCGLIYGLSVICNWIMKIKYANEKYYVNDRIQRYDNTFILIGSVCLFLLFTKVNINNKLAYKLITFFSSTCFGIYIIQVYPVYWSQIISKRYIYLLDVGRVKYVFYLLLYSTTMFIFLAFIDKIRQVIFTYCRVNELIDKVSKKLIIKFKNIRYT